MGSSSQSDRYLVMSLDSHVSPPREAYRDYCETKHLAQFDAWAAKDGIHHFSAMPEIQELELRFSNDPGVNDPDERLANMDADGITAEVIFHGNPSSKGGDLASFRVGDKRGPENYYGYHLFNRWLADYTAQAPERLMGVAQIPRWDIDGCVAETAWAAEHGVRYVNLPGMWPGMTPYDDEAWEPLWNVCEDAGIVLHSHAGGVYSPEMVRPGPIGNSVFLSQHLYMGRRHLAYLLFGGVFERHPRLKLVLAEQRLHWIPDQLVEWDGLYHTPLNRVIKQSLPRPPSEYFREHFFLGTSFLAHFEAELRHEIGLEMYGWGRDFPHFEGTWPHTLAAMQSALWDVPTGEVRQILGENAVRFYGLDRKPLADIAARIGPRPEEVATKLESIPPDAMSHAFRDNGTYSLHQPILPVTPAATVPDVSTGRQSRF